MLHFSTDYAVMTPGLIISCATFDYLYITSVPESGKSILLDITYLNRKVMVTY